MNYKDIRDKLTLALTRDLNYQKGFKEGYEEALWDIVQKLSRYLDHRSNCDSLKNESGLGCSCGLSKTLEKVNK